MTILLRSGRLIDPSQSLDSKGDLLISGGQIAAIGNISDAAVAHACDEHEEELVEIDAIGLCVMPGWVDMHAHLREPGDEGAETIASGAQAAAKGGITSVVCLPDTAPPIDTESAVEYVRLQSARAHGAQIFASAALTKNCEGESLAELGQLRKAGALAFTDCKPIRDSSMLLKGLQYASMLNMPVIDIARDPDIGSGVMNAGRVATMAGLSGSASVAEELAVVRGCLLAREAGGHYHVATVSAVETVKRIDDAREDGVDVSASVAPFSLLLTDEVIRERYDTRYKLRPPLRTSRDIDGLMFGLRIGVLSCIVSAHAPVPNESKDVEFDIAPYGGSTLEVTLPAAIEALHHRGGIGMREIVEAGSTNPARILGLKNKGSLRVGSDADVTLVDLGGVTNVDARDFVSRSKISPYDGMKLRASVKVAIVAGEVVASA